MNYVINDLQWQDIHLFAALMIGPTINLRSNTRACEVMFIDIRNAALKRVYCNSDKLSPDALGLFTGLVMIIRMMTLSSPIGPFSAS